MKKTAAPRIDDIDGTVQKIKAQILKAIVEGRVPLEVASIGEVGDHLRTRSSFAAWVAQVGGRRAKRRLDLLPTLVPMIWDEVDEWLATGGHFRALRDSRARVTVK